ncbi:hypothetical protein [Desulfosarcina variabilis]|uniref:hypothetical protein n=1 Tax=Desulfosarcina variabilis TaxID=2300 RepID=UPI003AFB0401
MDEQKIGIGPNGSVSGLLQLLLLTVIGIFVFVYLVPLDIAILKIMPATLMMLVVLGHLSLLGDNFPFSPPGGGWTPQKSRVMAGLGMTLIWVLGTAALLAFLLYVYPRWPMGPLYLWFGVIAFWLTLLYGINWNGWPFKGTLHPWATMAVSFVIILVLSIIIWSTLTNLDGTPFAETPSNHHGPLNADWLTGFLVWSIAWFFIFNPVFTTQGWPFLNLGHPGGAIAQTITAHVLGYVCWTGSLALGLSPSFSFAAVASSIIFWALVYSWHLQFWGITRLTFFKRAISALVMLSVLITAWILILRLLLAPAATSLAAANIPADINILIIYVNLCIVGPALIAHNAFWLRWPLTIPEPPGTPPPDVRA